MWNDYTSTYEACLSPEPILMHDPSTCVLYRLYDEGEVATRFIYIPSAEGTRGIQPTPRRIFF